MLEPHFDGKILLKFGGLQTNGLRVFSPSRQRLLLRQSANHPWLARKGHEVNRKRVQRLLRILGLEVIHRKPKLSAGRGHKVYPYLLRDVSIDRVGQVWSADITYLPLA